MTPEFECKCAGLELSSGQVCLGCRANAAIREAVLAERERCAKVAMVAASHHYGYSGGVIADAIREGKP